MVKLFSKIVEELIHLSSMQVNHWFTMFLWGLNLCVNLARPGHPDGWPNTCGCYGEGIFYMRLTFKSVGSQ